MQYRLAYLGEAYVNWCPALGTVLANDEVINGVSYRGGHPVVRKQMRQWSLRITNGNLTSGTDLVRRVEGVSVHAIGTPLITNSDGTKFGKSEGNAIWLDAETATFAFWEPAPP